MIAPQFLNRLGPSFTLFIDHEMLYRGQGYVNVNSGELFPVNDPSFPDKKIFASAYRQFVADSSVVGANIPSGVNVGFNFLNKGTSGLYIDYDMGRAIFSNTIPSNIQQVKTSYSYKEYNVYYNESQDDQLIFEAKYPVRPLDLYGNESKTPLQYNQVTYPAIFVKSQYTENVPFAFGGLDETILDIRCTFLADSTYLLDAGVSIASDMSKKYFPVLSPKDMPFNIYGDYKNGIIYNFKSLYSQYCQTGSLMALIDSVKISKFAPSVNKLIGNNAFGAFADFTVKWVRQPRL